MPSRLSDLPSFSPENFKPLRFLIPALVLIVAFLVVRSAVVFVPPGSVAAIYDRGVGVLAKELKEGINILIPFWQTPQLFDARLQEYTMSTAPNEGTVLGDDSLDAPTADGQQVKVDATIMFRIEPGKSPVVWKEIGADYINKIIRPITRSQIRMIVSRYTAPQIYSEKRQEAESVMVKEITDLLKDKHVILDRVLLRGVYFSAEYSKAIEDKVIAEQRVKQADYEVQEAGKRAEAKIAEARGLAEAQVLQKQSLTQEYLQLEAIKKWDGKLPVTFAGQTVPFLNLKP